MFETDSHPAPEPCGDCDSFAAAGASFCGACGRSLAEPDVEKTTTLRAVPHEPDADASSAGEPVSVGAIDPPGVDHAAHAEVPDADGTASAVTTKPKRWKKRIAVGTAVVLVLSMVGLAARTHLQTRHDLSDTRAALASTSRTLASTEDTLDETTSELDDTSALLHETKQQLKTRTSERDALQAQATDLETDLAGVRGSLANAEQRITLQSGQITNLRSCLQGVSNSLVYLADGYYSAALGAIQAVEVSCNAAMEDL